MLISELAALTGVSPRALRHYDRAGLLESSRRGNGYRDFTTANVEQVRRIRMLLSVGLALADVATLMPCFGGTGRLSACPAARDRLREQIGTIDRSIDRLRATRAMLTEALAGMDAPERAGER